MIPTVFVAAQDFTPVYFPFAKAHSLLPRQATKQTYLTASASTPRIAPMFLATVAPPAVHPFTGAFPAAFTAIYTKGTEAEVYDAKYAFIYTSAISTSSTPAKEVTAQ